MEKTETDLGADKAQKNLYIVGFGPGSIEAMTGSAVRAIEDSRLIVGYTVYVKLLSEHFPDKEYLSTGMRHEKERVELALREAAKGIKTALVCSGDSVVYGMAALAYQLKEAYPDVHIKVVAGVTAALSGGAELGAPLTNDFCVISLSDLLTPWEKIEKRLRAAAMGDFAIAIYNPSSKKRGDYLKKACNILLEYKSPDTVCGYVRNIGREGQTNRVLTLGELAEEKADMFTTIFVGNSETLNIGGHMVTPRGYRIKEVIIFGGTTEGRLLAEYCAQQGIRACVSVTTEYGAKLIPKSELLSINEEKLDEEGMLKYIKSRDVSLVIDATHPYALKASENIKKACEKSGVRSVRLVREETLKDKAFKNEDFIMYFDSIEDIVNYLNENSGNVFIATGSKEAGEFRRLNGFEKRCAVRILDVPELIEECEGMGYKRENIIAMRGPFTVSQNVEHITKYGAKYFVTKDSGSAGGFYEKLEAAEECNALLLVLRRPKEEGLSLDEIKAMLLKI